MNFANGKINIIASTESIEKTYVRTAEEKSRKGTVRYNDDYKADSIESELNTTIRIDADVGSTITLDEAYKASSKNAGLSVSQVVTRHIGEYYSKNEVNSSDTTQTDADLELLALQMRATQKLLASNGNENLLTAEEREALGTELSIIKQSFKRKKELQEVKDEVVSKPKRLDFWIRWGKNMKLDFSQAKVQAVGGRAKSHSKKNRVNKRTTRDKRRSSIKNRRD